jgi:hypothetical protein
MKTGSIILSQSNDIVAGGFYFKAIFNWWQISAFIIVITFLIYLFIKRKRK